MKRAITFQVIAVSAIVFGLSLTPAMAQAGGMTVTVYEGESTDKKLNCNDPRTQTATMTVADAGSVTVANPVVAGATLVDPNGNDGKGSSINKGQVESPTIRITGNKAGRTTVTIKLSCPDLFNPTHGIGLAKHEWQTVTITVIVLKRPDVPTEPGGGGKGGDGKGKDGDGKGGLNGSGGKGSKPPKGPDVPTYDPRFYEYKDGKLVPRSDAPRSTSSVNRNMPEAALAGARIVMTGYVVEGAPATFSVVSAQGRTLSGVVVTVGDRQVVTDEQGRATITVDGSVVSTRDDGSKGLAASVVGASAAPATAIVVPNSSSGEGRPVIEFLPLLVAGADPLTIRGSHFDPSTVVQVSGESVPVLASSGIELKADVSAVPPGRQEVKVINEYGSDTAATNKVQILLTATQTTVPNGGDAVATARAEGLAGMPREAYPLSIEMLNESSSKIRFQGPSPSAVRRSISYGEVGADGSFTLSTPFHAISPGEFQIVATILPAGFQDSDGGKKQDDPCEKKLDDANKKRAEAGKKRSEAGKLRTEAEELNNGPQHYRNQARSLGEKRDAARRGAQKVREEKAKDWGSKGPKIAKETYDAEIDRLEKDANEYDRQAKQAEETANRLDKDAPKSAKDRQKLAKNKEGQAKNLDEQADKLEKEAADLEKEYEKCKKKK